MGDSSYKQFVLTVLVDQMLNFSDSLFVPQNGKFNSFKELIIRYIKVEFYCLRIKKFFIDSRRKSTSAELKPGGINILVLTSLGDHHRT